MVPGPREVGMGLVVMLSFTCHDCELPYIAVHRPFSSEPTVSVHSCDTSCQIPRIAATLFVSPILVSYVRQLGYELYRSAHTLLVIHLYEHLPALYASHVYCITPSGENGLHFPWHQRQGNYNDTARLTTRLQLSVVHSFVWLCQPCLVTDPPPPGAP